MRDAARAWEDMRAGSAPRVLAIAGCIALWLVHHALYPTPRGPWSGLAPEAGVGLGAQVLAVALACVFAAARLAPRRPAPRALVLAAAATIGVAIGYALIVARLPAASPAGALGFWTAPLAFVSIAWAGVALFIIVERDRAAVRALRVEQERRLDVERQAAEARLQVLRSQVEPHFLFNTLAHLRRLYAIDPESGRGMMRDLVTYLSAATPSLQQDGIPLARDAELATAFLNLHKVRMGDRLAFRIDVEPAASSARVPPMTITTLAENAIKHGLADRRDGGAIAVSARVEGARVAIEVADTGRGLRADLGTGVGLANLRARLAALHGGSAALSLRANAPSGVSAIVEVPLAGDRA